MSKTGRQLYHRCSKCGKGMNPPELHSTCLECAEKELAEYKKKPKGAR